MFGTRHLTEGNFQRSTSRKLKKLEKLHGCAVPAVVRSELIRQQWPLVEPHQSDLWAEDRPEVVRLKWLRSGLRWLALIVVSIVVLGVVYVGERWNAWWTASSGAAFLALWVLAFVMIRERSLFPVAEWYPSVRWCAITKYRYEKLTAEAANRTLNLYIADCESLATKLFPTGLDGLMEMDSRDIVAIKDREYVLDLIANSNSGSIGIVGLRGIGKTSLMYKARRRHAANGVSVIFPTVLAGKEGALAASLLILTARQVLAESPPARPEPLVKLTLMATVAPLAVVLTALVSVSWSQWMEGSRSELILGLAAAALLFGGLAVIFGLSALLARFMGDISSLELAKRRAALVLRRHTNTVTEEMSARGGIHGLSYGRAVSLASRKAVPGEVAQDFHSLVDAYARRGKHPRRILVIVDELDRLPIEEVESALNQIKDLVHLDGVVVVASMSYEAKLMFDQRESRGADVFDSTFDEVVELLPIRAIESCRIIKSRVVGLPTSVQLLCHAMSGGRPRELLRLARRFIIAYQGIAREANGVIGLADVAEVFVGEAATEVRRGVPGQYAVDSGLNDLGWAYCRCLETLRPLLSERGGWCDETVENCKASDDAAEIVRKKSKMSMHGEPGRASADVPSGVV